MKFHPHLHLIVANGFFDKNNSFNSYDISFNSKFNRIWRVEMLKKLYITDFCKYKYGFYVWSDNKAINKTKKIGKYIGRYVRHPVIANSRIVKCQDNKINFYYINNKNEKIIIKKSITNFITSLTQHIPPPQFRLIRYYGAYSRNQRSKYKNYFNGYVGNIPLVCNQWTKSTILFCERVYFRACSKTT